MTSQVDPNEAEIVAALRRGDEAAFAWLVDQHHATLVRLALRYVPDVSTAEEVAQDTWLQVLRGLARFQLRSSLKTWITSILLNRARTRARRERRARATRCSRSSAPGGANVDSDTRVTPTAPAETRCSNHFLTGARMSPEEIGRTIQLILAPVVMFSACSIFVGGVLGHYTSIGDRIRALTRERLEVLRALRGPATDADGLLAERLAEIDGQLPELLHRHRLVHHAVLAVYAAIGILVLTMCVIALTAAVTAAWVAPLVFGVFLAAVLMMLVGVVLVTVEIRSSRRSLVFEARRVSGLSAGVTAGTIAETKGYGSFVSAPASERA